MTTISELASGLLRKARVDLEDGLTDREFDELKERLGVRFGVDHRDLLADVVPVSPGFPDWRHGTVEDLRRRLDWPLNGVLWDVENNGFWAADWSRRPMTRRGREAAVREQLLAAPQLVPVLGHRFVPGSDAPTRVPGFSVMQTDIVYWGASLAHLIARELTGTWPPNPPTAPRVPFWWQIAEREPGFVRKGSRFWNRSIEGGSVLPEGEYYVEEV